MRTSHIVLLSLIALSSCRSRESTNRLNDISPSVLGDPAGLELEIDTKSLASANLNFTHSQGKLQLWSMLYDDATNQKINPRIAPFKLDSENPVAAALLQNPVTTIKTSVGAGGFSFSGIPGTNEKQKIATHQKGGRDMVYSRSLTDGLFRACPTSYFSENGPFVTLLRKAPTPVPFAIEKQTAEESLPTLISVTYRPDGVTWNLNCSIVLSWSDVNTTKVIAQLSFEIRLTSDKVIFPGAASDSKYPIITEEQLNTDRDGRGTRYFKNYAAFGQSTNPIQRWNPGRARIVIDDVNDSFGKPLAGSEHGRWVQEGLKIATADLRMKIPYLGRKIALTSEQPRLSPDIAFALGDAQGAAGLAMMMLDEKNGEIRQARIGIGEESKVNGRLKMLEGFAKYGMIDDPKRSFRDAFLVMVIHELGHTLGLRHNFEGYGMTGNWGNDLQACMSYAMLVLPMEFMTDKVEWKPHDLLSLQILYSEMAGNDSRTRQSLVSEVLKYPLSKDEMLHDNPFGMFGEHFVKGLSYLETTNNPKVVQFREANRDWKNKIKAIYKEAYDVDLD